MGVTGLWKLVEQSGKPVPLETLENKVLAVDISIWLHQVVKGYQDSTGSNIAHSHVLGLFHRLCKLLFYRIKPVFVFDGGVPQLKRETIAKRNQSKNKMHNEADRLQQLLLETLAKEKVVQQALGTATELLISPSKKVFHSKDEEKDDIFKLPPMKEDPKSADSTLTSMDEDSWDEEKSKNHYQLNLQAIDVTSIHFKSLPADVRHDILSDIKETRKQSSWGRLHELPVQSNDFSSFQMKKLLKRRKVQVELEEAEKEMGGKCLSLAELESLLTEEGIDVKNEKSAQQIASSENSRFLLVRDVQKAIETAKAKEMKEKMAPTPPKMPKLDEDVELDEDAELQYAIQMSLLPDAENVEAKLNESDEVKMSEDQKKHLSEAAQSLARNYMLEYGSMSADEINDLLAKHDNDEDLDKTMKDMFLYNDASIIKGKPLDETEKIGEENLINSDSDADSDFIDVPVDDLPEDSGIIMPLNLTNHFKPNYNNVDFTLDDLKLNTNTGKILEVVVDKTKLGVREEDDIFADVFESPMVKANINPEIEEDPKQLKPEASVIEVDKTTEKDDEQNADNQSILAVELSSSDESESELEEPLKVQTKMLETIKIDKKKPAELKEISLKLKNELELLKEQALSINLNDIILPTIKEDEAFEIPTTPKKGTLENYVLSTTPRKDQSPIEEEEVVPKVQSPFFVKRTPPSSHKKKNVETEGVGHIRVSKTLFPDDAEVSSTSKVLEPEVIIIDAVQHLKENNTEKELRDMALDLVKEQRELLMEKNKKNRMGISITEQMQLDCMDLLKFFGVPYMVAPMEAEAQCAFLDEINLTDGTITDDSDIWLFGGKTVYKNFFNQNKLVMEFKVESIENLFSVDRHKMIQLAMLVGSDYTQGVHGIGAVTALEILATFPATPEEKEQTSQMMSLLSGLRKFREWWKNGKAIGVGGKTALKAKLKNIDLSEGFPSPNVVDAYIHPTVDASSEKFTWGEPDAESIREYAKQKFGWTRSKTDDILVPVLKKIEEKRTQQTITDYFKVQSSVINKEIKVSKRVQKAVNKMAGVQMEEEPEKPMMKAIKKNAKPKVETKKATKGRKKAEKNEDVVIILDDDDVAVPAMPKPPIMSVPTTSSSSLISNIISNINDQSAKELLGDDAVQTRRSRLRNKIPDFTPAIPQKVKGDEEKANNKLKAIEAFKKSKKSKN